MWRCRTCGQTFVTRNMPHSCQVVALDEHFAASEPGVRATFDALLAAIEALGPVTVNATKSRISLQARMRFAAVERPRRRHLNAHLVLTRPIDNPRFTRVEHLEPYYHLHHIRLETPADIDAELKAWLAEAYEVGLQRHVTDPGWTKVRAPGAGPRSP
jgi:Domain of unknown function (DUF5655)